MRKELIGAASAIALLMSGAAWAQSDTSTAGTTDRTVTSTGSETSSSSHKSSSASHSASAKLDRTSAEKLMGKTVLGANGEEIGEVADVILNASTNEAEQLVISSGGFMGMGDKKFAVDFKQAQIDANAEQVRVSSLTKEQIESMQEFQYEDNTVSLTRQGGGDAGSPGTPSQTGRAGSGASGATGSDTDDTTAGSTGSGGGGTSGSDWNATQSGSGGGGR